MEIAITWQPSKEGISWYLMVLGKSVIHPSSICWCYIIIPSKMETFKEGSNNSTSIWKTDGWQILTLLWLLPFRPCVCESCSVIYIMWEYLTEHDSQTQGRKGNSHNKVSVCLNKCDLQRRSRYLEITPLALRSFPDTLVETYTR